MLVVSFPHEPDLFGAGIPLEGVRLMVPGDGVFRGFLWRW